MQRGHRSDQVVTDGVICSALTFAYIYISECMCNAMEQKCRHMQPCLQPYPLPKPLSPKMWPPLPVRVFPGRQITISLHLSGLRTFNLLLRRIRSARIQFESPRFTVDRLWSAYEWYWPGCSLHRLRPLVALDFPGLCMGTSTFRRNG